MGPGTRCQPVGDDGVPLLWIMAVNQRRPTLVLNAHTTDRGKLAVPVHPEGWQVLIGERSPEIAAVTTDNEGSRLGTDPDRLVTSRMAVGEQAHHTAVTE